MSQRLIFILDWFRNKLAEEQLLLADALAKNEELEKRLNQLEAENVQKESPPGETNI